MASFQLDPVEARVLGCLLEKERTTPEAYPLSLNALVAACNQTTNREPVVAWDDQTVEAGVAALREKKLATMVWGAGARVQKFRHNLPDHFELNAREVALLCVLLLRGPQTPGELRARVERMAPFSSLADVESTLAELARGNDPLVQQLPARPGQKENRFVEVWSERSAHDAAPEPSITAPSTRGSKVEALESELAALRSELQQLREEFAAFRKQFE